MKKIVNESLGAVHTDILIDKLSRKITKNEIKINDIYCKSYTNDKTKIAGITLIALIITIIVLIVLAGVTVFSLQNTEILNKSKMAQEKTKYESAKEIIELKLIEVKADCYSQNITYDIDQVEKAIKDSNEITIEKFYNDNVASIKDGTTENVVNLSGIVVSANEYNKYKFLLGKEGDITGVTNKKIAETTDEKEFVNVAKFEKETLKISSNDSKDNVKKVEDDSNKYYLFKNGTINNIVWTGKMSGGTSNVGSYTIGKLLEIETHGIWCGYVVDSPYIDFSNYKKICIKFESLNRENIYYSTVNVAIDAQYSAQRSFNSNMHILSRQYNCANN